LSRRVWKNHNQDLRSKFLRRALEGGAILGALPGFWFLGLACYHLEPQLILMGIGFTLGFAVMGALFALLPAMLIQPLIPWIRSLFDPQRRVAVTQIETAADEYGAGRIEDFVPEGNENRITLGNVSPAPDSNASAIRAESDNKIIDTREPTND
jgi:hypothetical protein